MCVNVWPVCIHVYHLLAWCPWGSENGLRYPGIGVNRWSEPQCGCWESDLGPLLTTEPSLQPHCLRFLFSVYLLFVSSTVLSLLPWLSTTSAPRQPFLALSIPSQPSVHLTLLKVTSAPFAEKPSLPLRGSRFKESPDTLTSPHPSGLPMPLLHMAGQQGCSPSTHCALTTEPEGARERWQM